MSHSHNPIIIYDVDGPLIPSTGPRLLAIKYFKNPWFQWNEEAKSKINSLEIIRMFESCETENNLTYIKEVHKKFKKLLPKRRKRWAFFIRYGLKFRKYEYLYGDFIHGAVDIIKNLDDKGYIQGICSNSEKHRIVKWLKKKKIRDIIQCFTSRTHKHLYGLKPSPGPLLGVLALIKRKYGLDKIERKRTVFIGDNITDIIAAKKAGMPSVGVLSGHAYKHELVQENPDFIINDVTELPQILPQLFPEFAT